MAASRFGWLSAALLALAVVAAPADAQKGKPKPAKPAKPAAAKKVDVDAERAALLGADVDKAVAAAAALGESADAKAHDVLADALATGLAPDVAAAALAALGRHPEDSDVAVVAFFGRYRDAEVRAAAAGALAGYKAKPATDALLRLLADDDAKVRAAAAKAAGEGKVRAAAEPLLALLAKGDEPAAGALAAIADVELARVIGEQLGQVNDDLLATALGGILARKDFGPDASRVEVVRALGKIKGATATSALADYVSATPENPPRQSRREAESLVEARLGGDE
jgi:hypothetical protein